MKHSLDYETGSRAIYNILADTRIPGMILMLTIGISGIRFLKLSGLLVGEGKMKYLSSQNLTNTTKEFLWPILNEE